MTIQKILNARLRACHSIIILFLILMLSSCSNENSDKEPKKEDIKKEDAKPAETSKEDPEINNAAKEVCKCFEDFERSISEKGKRTLMEETKNETEMVSDKLGKEDKKIFLTKGVSAYDCLKSLEKKYTFLTNYSDEQLKQFNNAIKINCSEFVAAVMTVK